MCDMQTNLHKEVCAEVTEAYGNGMKIFKCRSLALFEWVKQIVTA
jgi:hypothetical protein